MKTEEKIDKVKDTIEDEINLMIQEINPLKKEQTEKEIHQALHLNANLKEKENVPTRIRITKTTREETFMSVREKELRAAAIATIFVKPESIIEADLPS
jgi:hypothetical protein